MSTTTRTAANGWESYHQRAGAVQDVLTRLPRHRGSALPWDDALATVFDDRDDLLEALHGVWTRRLLARVDLALEVGAGDTPRQSVESAWRTTVRELPALRALLDEYADTEVARRCVSGEHRLMAVAAGLATLSDPTSHSVRRGAELVSSIHPAPAPHRRATSHRLGWLRGCRHVTAAA